MCGFLSAFYAMLNFAYVEHKCVMPMFTRMGIPGGVKRYNMDDIIVALLCRSPAEVAAATAFVHELNKPAVYPPPWCLNMEPQCNQEFSEANLSVSGNRLALRLNNNVVVDALYQMPPYRQKLPTNVSRAANRRAIQGILARIMQSTSSEELIVTGISALRYEAQYYKIRDSLIRQVVSHAQAKARERQERDVVKALDKASQAMKKL